VGDNLIMLDKRGEPHMHLTADGIEGYSEDVPPSALGESSETLPF